MCKSIRILAVLVLAAGALLAFAAVSSSLPLGWTTNAAVADPRMPRPSARHRLAGAKSPNKPEPGSNYDRGAPFLDYSTLPTYGTRPPPSPRKPA